MRPSRIVAPVALTLALALLAADWRLRPTPPAAIGHPFPHFALAELPGTPALTDATLRAGHPTLVNVFASWCLPCRAEAPALAALRVKGIVVTGIAVRDAPVDAAAFLTTTRTRFAAAGVDPRGRVQTALASDGVPETWLVDGRGVVRARWRGNLAAADVPRVITAATALP